MDREYGQSPDPSNGNRRYSSHTNAGYRNNASDRPPQGNWRHSDRERDMDDHLSGQHQYNYNYNGQGMNTNMNRSARGYTPARGGYNHHYDTPFNNNNNGNHRQDYTTHADTPSYHNTNRNIESTYAYVKTTVGPNDTPRGPFRSTSESLTNPNPSETLKAYQQNTGQAGRDFDGVKGFGGNNSDYQGLGSTNAFFDQVYEKLHPDQGKLDRGFADKNTGTKTAKTITRTFCEMATQTTEDDMPDSTYNGVSVAVRTRASITRPAAVDPKTHRLTDQPPSQSHVAGSSNMARETRETRDMRNMRDMREIEPKRQTTHKDESRDHTNHDNRTPSNPPSTSKPEANPRTSGPNTGPISAVPVSTDGWGNVSANKGAGEMVDWSSGAVAEFPEEAKPTKMTVTPHWGQSRIQPKAPVQPLPETWGPPKKDERKADQTLSQPSTSNMGYNNQGDATQALGRSVQETKVHDDPWLTGHAANSSTDWSSVTGQDPPQDDHDTWVTGGNNNEKSNEWSFMADNAKASWSAPSQPAPTSWGATPGVSTDITPPEQPSSSKDPSPSVAPSELPSPSWGLPVPPVVPTEQRSTSWGPNPVSVAPPEPAPTRSPLASSTETRYVPSTSTERFNKSLQKLAAGYGGLSSKNDGSYEHVPRSAPSTSRWTPLAHGSIDNQAQPEALPQQQHGRTSSTSFTHSGANSFSPKMNPNRTPPVAPPKAPGPNARRIQFDTSSPDIKTAAWLAASKSAPKPRQRLFTAATPTTVIAADSCETGATTFTESQERKATKTNGSGGVLATANDFQRFLLAANTFVPPTPTKSLTASVSDDDETEEAKDDTVTDPEPEPKEKGEEDMESDCGSQLNDDRESNKGSERSSKGSEFGSGKESSSTGQTSGLGNNAWGELPIEREQEDKKEDNGAHANLIVLEEDKDPHINNKPVARNSGGGSRNLATSSDFQSFLLASKPFVPPVKIKEDFSEGSEDDSKSDEAKNDPEVNPKQVCKKKEEKKHEEEEKRKEDEGSDARSQGRDSGKGSELGDDDQPSRPVDSAWGEPVEKGGLENKKDDGRHPNLIVLEENKDANKNVSSDKSVLGASDRDDVASLRDSDVFHANVVVHGASDRLEALQNASQMELKAATKTSRSVSPAAQDDPKDLKAVEAALPVSPPALQGGPVELKVAAETSLPVSPPVF
ncbi:hypothetical protein CPC16_005669 [Podila verticillata]|nr:hypothetical protein CPC16_005669 [Podila verticillata]